MSRPMLLVFLLMILIITSQFEWRQPLVSEVDANQSSSEKIQPRVSNREETVKEKWRQPLVSEVDANQSSSDKIQPRVSNREETVKEKIILSQEKSIQKLSVLVQSLRQQLSECQSNNGSTNSSLSNLIIELERQQFIDN